MDVSSNKMAETGTTISSRLAVFGRRSDTIGVSSSSSVEKEPVRTQPNTHDKTKTSQTVPVLLCVVR